jgi:hypothetical protein
MTEGVVVYFGVREWPIQRLKQMSRLEGDVINLREMTGKQKPLRIVAETARVD